MGTLNFNQKTSYYLCFVLGANIGIVLFFWFDQISKSFCFLIKGTSVTNTIVALTQSVSR
jgi:hypothetical protein